MKRALVPGVLVLLLALSACSGTETTGEQSVPTTAATNAQAGAQRAESDAPLTAETPAASEDTDEATFVADVREELPANTVIPNASDAQLIDAGMKVCDLKTQGVNPDDWTVIDGEQRSALGYYNDTAAIAKAAIANLCR